jgi:hypothetical protein
MKEREPEDEDGCQVKISFDEQFNYELFITKVDLN